MVPMLVLGGAGVTGLLGWLWYDSNKKGAKTSPLPLNVKPPPAPPVLVNPATGVSHAAAVTPEAPMAPPATNVIKTPAGKPLVILTPKAPDGSPTVAATVATSGSAIGAAHALYDYLTAKGVQGSVDLVTAFQKAVNADADSKKLHGPIGVNGRFDLPTSAALTVYTGLPIPADPTAPSMPVMSAKEAQADPSKVDFSIPGPGAMAASNLWAYLKMHGNVNKFGKAFKPTDPILLALVKSFQAAVNVDPKFAGPSYAFPKLAIIKAPLKLDGQYGGKTSDALAAVSLERIAP